MKKSTTEYVTIYKTHNVGPSIPSNFPKMIGVNCEIEGHCLHEGTGVDFLYCCKCHTHILIGGKDGINRAKS